MLQQSTEGVRSDRAAAVTSTQRLGRATDCPQLIALAEPERIRPPVLQQAQPSAGSLGLHRDSATSIRLQPGGASAETNTAGNSAIEYKGRQLPMTQAAKAEAPCAAISHHSCDTEAVGGQPTPTAYPLVGPTPLLSTESGAPAMQSVPQLTYTAGPIGWHGHTSCSGGGDAWRLPPVRVKVVLQQVSGRCGLKKTNSAILVHK